MPAMKVELRLVDHPASGEMVPILWNSDAGEAPGLEIEGTDHFKHILRGVDGASNRTRAVYIVGGEAAARALAIHMEEDGAVAISKLADDVFSVGIVFLDGSRDDGVPSIHDIREAGRALDYPPGVEDLILMQDGGGRFEEGGAGRIMVFAPSAIEDPSP
jgi:hypothetical protein